MPVVIYTNPLRAMRKKSQHTAEIRQVKCYSHISYHIDAENEFNTVNKN